MKKYIFPLFLTCMLAVSSVSSAQEYSNPVLRRDCPDPTILDDRARSGYFYLYSTQSRKDSETRIQKDARVEDDSQLINLPIYRSKNLTDWEFVGDGFPEGRPDWVKKTQLWAPDINYVDGKYVLYYSLGAWAQILKEGSGVAFADSPEGPFKDQGEVVSFKSTGVTNSIDANLFTDDNGKKYIFWGSLGPGSGIWAAELSPDGKSLKEGGKKKRISASNMEGAYVFKKNGWYYLFASKGSCCNYDRSTYRVVVGRSKNIFGPYVGPDGRKMSSGQFENVIMHGDAEAEFVGTGHNTQILTDDAGQDWMAYHSYWKGNNYISRCLCIDKLIWDEKGWPYFEGSTPGKDRSKPVITH